MIVTAIVMVLWLIDLRRAARHGNAAGKSVHDLLAGRLAVYVYGGVLAVGVVLPIVLIAKSPGPTSTSLMAAIGVASVIGDFFIKYSTVKAGVYRPVRVASDTPRRAPRSVTRA